MPGAPRAAPQTTAARELAAQEERPTQAAPTSTRYASCPVRAGTATRTFLLIGITQLRGSASRSLTVDAVATRTDSLHSKSVRPLATGAHPNWTRVAILATVP